MQFKGTQILLSFGLPCSVSVVVSNTDTVYAEYSQKQSEMFEIRLTMER